MTSEPYVLTLILCSWCQEDAPPEDELMAAVHTGTMIRDLALASALQATNRSWIPMYLSTGAVLHMTRAQVELIAEIHGIPVNEVGEEE